MNLQVFDELLLSTKVEVVHTKAGPLDVPRQLQQVPSPIAIDVEKVNCIAPEWNDFVWIEDEEGPLFIDGQCFVYMEGDFGFHIDLDPHNMADRCGGEEAFVKMPGLKEFPFEQTHFNAHGEHKLVEQVFQQEYSLYVRKDSIQAISPDWDWSGELGERQVREDFCVVYIHGELRGFKVALSVKDALAKLNKYDHAQA